MSQTLESLITEITNKTIRKSLTLKFEFIWKSSKSEWGRFGGGWNWMLGIQWSRKEIIFNIFIFRLRFSIIRDLESNRK